MTNWNTWDEVGEKVESTSGDYFKIEEGVNKFILLTHLAPYAQVYEGGKYRPAQDGDTDISVKGICWVLQKNDKEEYVIKLARLPYTIVKAIKGIAEDPDWNFEFPFRNPLTLNAVGAGTKEVKYTLTPSPKQFDIPAGILEDLAKKPTPEEMVEKFKGNKVEKTNNTMPDYPEEVLNPEDIPF